jgi:hypothetical protein
MYVNPTYANPGRDRRHNTAHGGPLAHERTHPLVTTEEPAVLVGEIVLDPSHELVQVDGVARLQPGVANPAELYLEQFGPNARRARSPLRSRAWTFGSPCSWCAPRPDGEGRTTTQVGVSSPPQSGARRGGSARAATELGQWSPAELLQSRTVAACGSASTSSTRSPRAASPSARRTRRGRLPGPPLSAPVVSGMGLVRSAGVVRCVRHPGTAPARFGLCRGRTGRP